MKAMLERIQTGDYAKDFILENRAGAPTLLSRRRITAEHSIGRRREAALDDALDPQEQARRPDRATDRPRGAPPAILAPRRARPGRRPPAILAAWIVRPFFRHANGNAAGPHRAPDRAADRRVARQDPGGKAPPGRIDQARVGRHACRAAARRRRRTPRPPRPRRVHRNWNARATSATTSRRKLRTSRSASTPKRNSASRCKHLGEFQLSPPDHRARRLALSRAGRGRRALPLVRMVATRRARVARRAVRAAVLPRSAARDSRGAERGAVAGGQAHRGRGPRALTLTATR